MFAAILYPLMAVLYIGIVIWLVRDYLRTKTLASLLLALVLLGLVVDTTVISFGRLAGESGFLAGINLARYLAHAVLGPFSFLVAFELLRMAGVKWAGRTLRNILIGFVVIAAVGGIFCSSRLCLMPVTVSGVLRYVEDPVLTPGWAGMESLVIAVLTMVFFLVAGIVIWMKAKWAWLFLGTLVTFLGNGAPTGEMRFMVSSIVEVVWAAAIIATILYLRKRPISSAQ